MKLHIKFMAVLLTVFSATTIIAKTDSTESAAFCKVVAEKSDKVYRVVYNSPLKKDVTIEIYDKENEVVHTEKVSATTGFIKRYNLKNLSLGEYEIVVKTADYQFEEKIDLGGLNKYNVKLKNTGKNVLLQGSHPDGKDFHVYIYDQYNDLLYSEDHEDVKQLNKAYNLEKVSGKSVSFLIFSEERLIKKEIFEL